MCNILGFIAREHVEPLTFEAGAEQSGVPRFLLG